MAHEALRREVALRIFGMTPVRAFYIAPPLIIVLELNLALGWREDSRARHQILGQRSWKPPRKPTGLVPGHGPNRWRYSLELIKALTSSALTKSPLKVVSLPSQN